MWRGFWVVVRKFQENKTKVLWPQVFQNHRIILGIFCSLPRCSRYELTYFRLFITTGSWYLFLRLRKITCVACPCDCILYSGDSSWEYVGINGLMLGIKSDLHETLVHFIYSIPPCSITSRRVNKWPPWNVFSRQQWNHTYELIAVGTACIRHSQAQARQSPNTERKDAQ